MGDLFLSHSSRDKAVAVPLQAELEADGHRVFLDSDHEDGIAPGAEWMQVLFTELRLCHAVVFLNSANSQGSKWCHTELAIAIQMGKEIFALNLDPSPPLNPHPLLDHLQAVPIAESQRVRTELTRTRADDAREVRWDRDRSPYPGLAAFEPGDAGVFFGRDDDRARLVARVDPPLGDRDGRLIVVMGPSGCGKSSLVRAGLLPRIRTNPRWLALEPFEPGVTPMDRLVSRLVAASGGLFDALTCRGELETHGLARVAERLLDGRPVAGGTPRPQRLLITVDQAEQLLVDAAGDRTAFASLLGTGLQPGSPVTVVATLRSDRLDGFQRLPGLGEGMSEPLALAPLRRADLAAVIEGPAARAGLSFEPGLVAELIDDATRDSADSSVVGAMPLLAFTLRELADRAVASDRTLIAAQDYRDLGGIAGAISRRATETEQSLPPTAGAALDAVLLRLVTLREDRPPGARPLPRADLDAEETDVVRRLEDQRLLSGAGDEVRLVHEQLVASWPRLQRLVADRRADLLLQSRLERQAADWKAGTGEVLNSAAAADASGWLRRVDEAAPTEEVRTFVSASRRVHRRRRRRALGAVAAVAAFAVVAAGAAVVAVRQRRTAEATAERARSGELVALAQSTGADQPVIGALLAVEALYPNGRRDPIDSVDARNEVGASLRWAESQPVIRVGPGILAPATSILSFDSRIIRVLNEQAPSEQPEGETLVPDTFDVVTGLPIEEQLAEGQLRILYRPSGYLAQSHGEGFGLTRGTALAGPDFTDVVTFDAARHQYVGVERVSGDVVARSADGGREVARLAVPDGVSLAQIVVTDDGLVVGRTRDQLTPPVGGWFVWDLGKGGGPLRLMSDTQEVLDSDGLIPTGIDADAVPAQLVSIGPSALLATYDAYSPDPSVHEASPTTMLVELSPSGVTSQRRLSEPVPSDAGWAVSTSRRFGASRTIVNEGLDPSAKVEVWDLKSGERLDTIPSTDPTDIRWADDEDVLAVASLRNIEFWKPNLHDATGAADPIEALRIPIDRNDVVSSSANDDPRTLDIFRTGGQDISLSPDGRVLAVLGPRSLSVRSRVELLDTATKMPIPTPPTIGTAFSASVAFDPSGRFLAIGREGEVALVSASTWAIERTVLVGPKVNPGAVTRLAWSGDGSLLAVQQDSPVDPGFNISLISVATGRVHDLTGAARVEGPVALNHDGSLVAFGSGPRTVAFRGIGDGVATATGPTILTLNQPTAFAFSPDGDRFVIASRVEAQMIAVSGLAALASSGTGSERGETRHRIDNLAFTDVGEFAAFRPDGRSLVLAGVDGYLEWADFDPALACELATPADLEVARRLVGAPLACERIPELQKGTRRG